MEGGALIFVWVQIQEKMTFKETRKIQRKTPVNLFRETNVVGKSTRKPFSRGIFHFPFLKHTQVAHCHLKRFTQFLFLAKEQYEAGVTKQLFCDEGVFAGSFLNVLRWLILNRKNHCCAGA